MSWLTNCHGRVGIGKDFMGSFDRILPYGVHAVKLSHMSDIRSDEGLTLETSAFESLYGGQFTSSTQLMKPNYHV